MKVVHSVNFDYLVSLENILLSWDEFKRGKISKGDVKKFERHLEDNIFSLHSQLAAQTYKHGQYSTFHIFDPKHRVISKAAVRDRLVHHVIFNKLYEIFDPAFIFHSYSSRVAKGTHKAVKNLAKVLRQESRNGTRQIFILKCDIKKFFQSVNHRILLQVIKNKIKDSQFLWLIEDIVNSFPPSEAKTPLGGGLLNANFDRKGIPIGNLSSQIFANIYLNELDRFVKHKLRIKNYFRYADDFLFVHRDQSHLALVLDEVKKFLSANLDLELHPNKVSLTKFGQGVDFLGYIIFPHHSVLRVKTKKRMYKKLFQKQKLFEDGLLSEENYSQSLQSYFGLLKHCDSYELSNNIKNNFLKR